MWPMVEEAKSVLREAGRDELVAELTRLVISEQQARHAAEASMLALRAMQDRYEPRPKPDPYTRYTGD